MAEYRSEIDTLRRSAGQEQAPDLLGFLTEMESSTSVTG
jgi:hypothetical protein